MSARAEFSTKGGDILCRIITDHESVVFKLTPLEMLGLSNAALEYGRKALHAHATTELASVRKMLADVEGKTRLYDEPLSKIEPGRMVG